jgi:hypothetical protein
VRLYSKDYYAGCPVSHWAALSISNLSCRRYILTILIGLVILALLILYKASLIVAMTVPELRRRLIEPSEKHGYLSPLPVKEPRLYKTHKRYEHHYLGV